MHFNKRTFAALAIAAALISQSPVIARADGGNVQSSCYMSRTVNGVQTVSTDCGAMQVQMNQQIDGMRSLFGSLVPAPLPVFVPEIVAVGDPKPVAVEDIDEMMATIEQLAG
jgi:hypothetical protein